jgi:hypothetical protein
MAERPKDNSELYCEDKDVDGISFFPHDISLFFYFFIYMFEGAN